MDARRLRPITSQSPVDNRMFHRVGASVVVALVETLGWEEHGGGGAIANNEKLTPSADEAAAARVAEFVLAQRERMPDYLHLPVAVLTVWFDIVPILRTGHRFHRLPPPARRQVVARWRSSRWGFARDFLRFYECLSVFGALADHEESSSQVPDPCAASQETR